MRSNQVPIERPCHESWEAMDGGEERRFCGVCQKHVHNLSAMRHDEARELLQRSASDHLCVRYAAGTDGTLQFRDLVPRGQLTRKLLRTAFAATMLAACTPHTEQKPQSLGDVLIESQRGNVVATPDGGCNYTTGPFTTFHLPPGHALCSNAGPAEAPPIVTPPVIERFDVPVKFAQPTMGAVSRVDVPEPESELDPRPVAKMGEAIAVPENEDPFVPCDPHPGYAPPPPPQPPQAEPPGVRMGDYAGPEPEAPPPPRRDVPHKMGKLVAPMD